MLAPESFFSDLSLMETGESDLPVGDGPCKPAAAAAANVDDLRGVSSESRKSVS